MARPLCLLICLLIVASAYSSAPQPTTQEAASISASTEVTSKPGPTGGTSKPGPTGGTTKPGPTGGTTNPGPTGQTTKPGPTGQTTNPGPTGQTTKPGSTGQTTKPGPTGQTTKPGPTGQTTKPGPTGETTKPVITTKPKPTETEKPKAACLSSPCGGGSTCQDRAELTFVCLCPAGDNYDYALKQCIRAKVFPGDLTVEGVEYKDEMADPNSADFKRVADDIVGKLKKEYEKDPKNLYLGSVVTKLSKAPTGQTKAGGGVLASVEIKFSQESEVTQKSVDDGAENVGTWAVKKVCDNNPCDAMTAKCTDTVGGFQCSCQDGYLPSGLTERLCVACPSGEKADADSGTCKKCGFGKSGFNCKDSWQLILTIVGSVLGGLLLVCIILLPVVAMSSKKKVKKAKASSSYDKSKSGPAKTPQVSNGLAAPRPTPNKAAPAGGLGGFGANGVPRIPRATTYDSWDRNTNLEMAPSNSRQNLLPSSRNPRRFDDDDDSSPYSRPVKPQNNPYAVARPQANPYASNQGHTNPYYRQ